MKTSNRDWGRRHSAVIKTILCVLLGMVVIHAKAQPVTNFLRWETNGPAVFRVFSQSSPLVRSNVIRSYLRTNDGVRSIQRIWGLETNAFWFTNRLFSHLREDSFNYMVYTNVAARTNERTTQLWSERRHSPEWPNSGPLVRWNRRSLIFSMRGLTALSPCWEGEGSAGQIPITALTRRHGYTRGHGMGASGFGTRFAGKKVWFLTAEDHLVQVSIAREVVRVPGPDKHDYTIFLFDRDLPTSIAPLRVVAPEMVQKLYPAIPGAPRPLFMTEQSGHVSAEISGFFVATWKGGDSGSPNLLPMENELVFAGGRSTSGPSVDMQSDIEELCRLEGLRTSKYRLNWVDLGAAQGKNY